MFVSDCLSVNEAGHLTIGSADTVELARTYGTPLYVFDEGTIRDTLRQYKGSIDRYYGGKGLVAYASKAFACKEICRIVESEAAASTSSPGGSFILRFRLDSRSRKSSIMATTRRSRS